MKRFLCFKFLSAVALFAAIGCSTSRYGVNDIWRNRLNDVVPPSSKLLDAGPTWSIEQTADGRFLWNEYFYDTRKKVVESQLVNGTQPIVRSGKHQSWADNGILMEEGSYRNGEKEGTWKEFDWKSGELKSEGDYKQGLKNGDWKYFAKNRLAMVKTFVDDEQHGLEIRYDSIGKIGEKFLYEKGKLVKTLLTSAEKSDSSYTETPPSYPCDPVFAAFGEECSSRSLLQFLNSNIRYPVKAREMGLSGEVLVSYVVGKDGQIQDVEVIRGVSNELQTEVLRVLKLMPKWQPGIQNGHPVKVRYTLPVRFRLE